MTETAKMKKTYYLVSRKQYYSGGYRLGCIMRGTLRECRLARRDDNAQIYYTDHNEVGRHETRIVCEDKLTDYRRELYDFDYDNYRR